MKVRKPVFNFAESSVRWSTVNPEFARSWNIASLQLPYLEPYLNVVMRRAQPRLSPGHPLNEDISLFCKQEAQHYLSHQSFNLRLVETGYERVPEFEKVYETHYGRLLNEESLKFNCAYCAGIETLGPIIAEFLFEHLDDLFAGADPAVVGLWKWHFAEEYEHRSLCFDVYKTLFGDWLYRVYGIFCVIRDNRAFTPRVLKYLLEHDRKKMSAEEIRLSENRIHEYQKREKRFVLERLVRAASPSYDPGNLPPPRGVVQLLQQVDRAA